MSARPRKTETIVSKNHSGANVVAFPQKSSDGALAYLSPSSLKLYLTCSLKFYFKKILRLSEPSSPALVFGKAVHAALQAFWLARWRDGDASSATIIQAFRDAFAHMAQEEEVAFKAGEFDKLMAKGEALVQAYLDSDHAQEALIPAGVEVKLEEHYPELPSPLLGYVDLVKPGNVICDFKTCASAPDLDLEAFQHGLQLTAYQLLVESASGQKVTARELIFLVKTATPKVIVHRMPPADATAIARFWAMAEAAVEGIYYERFHPQPGMHCAWCSYREMCSQWKGCVS